MYFGAHFETLVEIQYVAFYFIDGLSVRFIFVFSMTELISNSFNISVFVL
jgi:hypothetical protein